MTIGTPFQVREGMHAPAVRRASAAEVPIVDFGALYSPSRAERKTMARAIHAACAGPGFFYIVNHQSRLQNSDRFGAAQEHPS